MEENKDTKVEEIAGVGAEVAKTADAPASTASSSDTSKKPASVPASSHRGPARGGRGPGGPGGRGPGGSGGRGGSGGGRGPGGGRGGGPRPRRDEFEVKSEYDEKNLEVARVTRVTKGGKRMRFRALTVIGNRKGRVGFGTGKGVDFPGSTSKAAAQARKSLITVPMRNGTIPHSIRAKYAAAEILLNPAPRGTGIKAGGPVRVVLELAGVGNVTAKILGSKNKINNVRAVFKALSLLKLPLEERNVNTEDKAPKIEKES
ncbi:MAG: 30S ribosomal protein S5 [bacterium]|nr:30S ribosomal protein S5 [bacterium]